jgi:hypothetical protein
MSPSGDHEVVSQKSHGHLHALHQRDLSLAMTSQQSWQTLNES